MHSPQTAIPDPPPAFSMSGLGHFSYGLAWVVTAYRGHNLVWHNGGIDGFYALLSMLPDDHLGVVVLTNLPHGQTRKFLPTTSTTVCSGSILCPGSIGSRTLKPKARNRKRKPRRTSPPTASPARIPRKAVRGMRAGLAVGGLVLLGKKQEEEAKKNKPADRKTGTHPSHSLAEYAGEYQNPGYGILKVAVKGDALELSLNRLGPFPLEHYHYDIFRVPEDSDSVAAGEKFQFELKKKGDIDRIAATLEPALGEDLLFTRSPEKVAKDLLQQLAGDYLLADETVTVALV